MKSSLGVMMALACLQAGTALAGTTEVVASEGGARLVRHNGVWLMRLEGTREEMAAQHGRFIRELWEETALPYFASKLAHSIEQAYIVKDAPALGDVAKWGIDAMVLSPLIRRIPDGDRAVLEAFARAAGMPIRDALSAFVVPDAGQWLLARLFGGQKLAKGFLPPTPFGCTSYVSAKGDAATGWVHARNLDYDSYGIFDRYPVVIYFNPSEPGAQPYASFTSLGIHTAGITAANASGITLSLHQVMVDDVSSRGEAILSVNDRVIREARTLDEALAILRKSEFAGSWAIQVASARERRAVSVEVSAGGIHVRETGGGDLVMTNHVFGEDKKAREFAFTYSYPVDSRERYAALSRALAAKDSLDTQGAIDLISGAFHRIGPIAGAPESWGGPLVGTVAKGNNIQSVVMLPERGAAYVAVPRLEAAKPLDGAYVGVPLDFEGIADPDAFLASVTAAPEPMSSSSPLAQDALEAQTLLRQATSAASDFGRFEVALEMLKKASLLQPAEPHYAVMTALMAFRAYRLDEGYLWLEIADSLEPGPYHQALIQLFRGRYHDILGRRDSAVEQYRLALETEHSQALTEAIEAGLKRPYKPKALRKLVLDPLLGDVYRF